MSADSPGNRRPEARRPAARERVRRTAALVARVVRQERSDGLAVKLLPRIVFGIAACYTLFVIAASSGDGFVGVCLLAAAALAFLLLRRRPQLALALASTAVTCAATGWLVSGVDRARGTAENAAGATAVFGFWALAGMALLGAWMVRTHSGGRGVTVLLADVCLLGCALLGVVHPRLSVPVGFMAVLTVLACRSRRWSSTAAVFRRRFRPGRAQPTPSPHGADAKH